MSLRKPAFKCVFVSLHAVLKSIDKGSFIDMLKTGGAGDTERTTKHAGLSTVRREDY